MITLCLYRLLFLLSLGWWKLASRKHYSLGILLLIFELTFVDFFFFFFRMMHQSLFQMQAQKWFPKKWTGASRNAYEIGIKQTFLLIPPPTKILYNYSEVKKKNKRFQKHKSWTKAAHKWSIHYICEDIKNDFKWFLPHPIPWHFVKLKWKSQLKIIEVNQRKTNTIPFPSILFNHTSASPWIRSKCPFPLLHTKQKLLVLKRLRYGVEV